MNELYQELKIAKRRFTKAYSIKEGSEVDRILYAYNLYLEKNLEVRVR